MTKIHADNLYITMVMEDVIKIVRSGSVIWKFSTSDERTQDDIKCIINLANEYEMTDTTLLRTLNILTRKEE